MNPDQLYNIAVKLYAQLSEFVDEEGIDILNKQVHRKTQLCCDYLNIKNMNSFKDWHRYFWADKVVNAFCTIKGDFLKHKRGEQGWGIEDLLAGREPSWRAAVFWYRISERTDQQLLEEAKKDKVIMELYEERKKRGLL